MDLRQRPDDRAPVAPDTDLSPEDVKIWNLVNDRYEEGKVEMQPAQLGWKLVLGFLNGYQWVTVDRIHRTLHVSPRKPGEVRVVDNQMAPIFKTHLSKLIQLAPTWGVRPASEQQADIDAADLGKRLLWHLNTNIIPLEKKLREAFVWMLSTGTGFVNEYWNPDVGPIADTWTVQGEPKTQEDLQGMYGDFSLGGGMVTGGTFGQSAYPTEALGWRKETISKGEQELNVESPFCIYVDPMATDLDNARWIIIVRAMSIDELYRQYGDDAKNVMPETMDLYGSSLEKETMDLFMNSFNIMSEAAKAKPDEKAPYVLVKQMQTKPRALKNEDKGRIVTIAGGRVLKNEDNPYNHGRFTVVMMRENVVPGHFWGKSTQEQLIPLQKRLNVRLSQIMEHNDRFAKGDWMIPNEANMDRPSNKAGGVYYYDAAECPGGHVPHIERPVGVPPSSVEEIRQLKEDIVRTGGSYEATVFGKLPGGVKSGVAIRRLQEQDESRMSITAAEIHDAMIRLGKMQLENAQQFYRETRMLKSLSEDRKTKVEEFVGADLNNNFDVIIETRSTLPKSQVAREEAVLAYYDRGLFGMPSSPDATRHARRLLELGEEPVGIDPDKKGQELAKDQNARMTKGEPVESRVEHNLTPAHIRVHRDFMLDIGFERLPPMIQMLVTMHIDEDSQWLMRLFPEAMISPMDMMQEGGQPQGGGQTTKKKKPASKEKAGTERKE